MSHHFKKDLTLLTKIVAVTKDFKRYHNSVYLTIRQIKFNTEPPAEEKKHKQES